MSITIVQIVSLLFVMRVFKMKIMHPCGIFATMWIVFILCSWLFLGADYYFDYTGESFIVLAVLLFVCGFQIAKNRLTRNRKENVPKSVTLPVIPWSVIVLFTFIAMLSVVVSSMQYGISLNQLNSFSALQASTHAVSVQRYTDSEFSLSSFALLLSAFIHVLPACAGYSWIYADTPKRKIIVISTFIPALASMLITSAKLAVISYVILFFAGYYTSYVYKSKKIVKLNLSNSIRYIVLGVLLFIAFIFSFVLRIGTGEQDILHVIIRKMAIYAFGHIQGFDTWFASKQAFDEELTMGGQTFLAISSRFGFLEKRQGVYGLISGSCTNVYTPFRGLIEDFGIIGTLVLMVACGAIVSYFYFQVIHSSKQRVGCQIGLILSFFCMLYFIVSPWTYTTFFVAMMVTGWFIWYSFRRKRLKLSMKFKFRRRRKL